MAFPALSDGHAKTPMDNLIEQKAIKEGIFAFYLGADRPGLLTIGE